MMLLYVPLFHGVEEVRSSACLLLFHAVEVQSEKQLLGRNEGHVAVNGRRSIFYMESR